MLRLIQAVSGSTPDILHGWMYHGNVAATLGSALSLRKKPVIWSMHHTITRLSDESPFSRRLIHLSARLSRTTSAISYCSSVSAHDHEKLGFDPSRRVIIPNGTDCDQFRPSAKARDRLRAIIDVPPSRLIVGHVGRFHPMKDQITLVRAIKGTLAKGLDIQGVFIGDGHVDGPVRKAAREFGIDDRITTLGVRHDILDLLPGLDIFVLSSAWGEAFSLAVGEAMACGIPAVVTAVGDSPWIVGSTGLVVPPKNADALTAAMAKLLQMDPEARRSLGIRARQRIIENFSLPLYVKRHLELYERALDSPITIREQHRQASCDVTLPL
jgi:glycosyltransferase involved in cell wall biosynthesis